MQPYYHEVENSFDQDEDEISRTRKKQLKSAKSRDTLKIPIVSKNAVAS